MSAVGGRGGNGGLRIVFGGSFARVPGFGGLAWMVLQHVLGLRRLGHRVLLLERIESSDLVPAGCAPPACANADYFRAVTDRFGIEESALVVADAGRSIGMPLAAIRAWADEADLLIDVAGGLAGLAELDAIGSRLYLDVDPGFTQLWQEAEGIDMRFDGYTDFATVGLAFDRTDRTVPDCGRDWIPTPPPVVLAEWPWADMAGIGDFTTIASWRGYGTIEANGRFYGQKAHSLRRIVDLPRRAGPRFRLALSIDEGESADLESLIANGWHLVDPRFVAATPDSYRRFVQASRGELGIAKQGYVEARCGWFSDRSVCYLASGRPVIAEDTGFGAVLPVGEGLFAYGDAGDIEAALAALDADYPRQRRAAREIAESYFDSDRVLPRLLDRIGVSA